MVTTGQKHQLLESQDYKCAVCMKKLRLKSQMAGSQACIDHDHVTGKVRGLLCYSCNNKVRFYERGFRESFTEQMITWMSGYLNDPPADYRGLYVRRKRDTSSSHLPSESDSSPAVQSMPEGRGPDRGDHFNVPPNHYLRPVGVVLRP